MREEKGILFFSDLHCGSIFGMLPPGFVNSAETIINQSPGQEYLWECWMDLKKRLPSGLVAAISNGDMLDGKQEAQKGTELILPRWEDQRKAAQETIEALELEIPIYFTQGCLAPGHPVLTNDLTWRSVENLCSGDKILGFEDGPIGIGGHRGIIETLVTATAQPEKECVEVVLADGTVFICTHDHPIWCRRWVRAHRLKPGDKVPQFLPHWSPGNGYEAGWMSGIFDGEATLAIRTYGMRKNLLLEVAQNRGVVLDGILDSLNRHGFAHSEYTNERDQCVTVHIKGGGSEILRFLGTFRPKRLIPKIIEAMKEESGIAFAWHAETSVTSVRPIGKRIVAGISTRNGTYISHGYGHHNTEYHDSKGGSEVEALGAALGTVKYRSLGTGIYSKEVINLEVDGVVINAAHGISGSGGLYRATAPDREGIWSALAGKEGKMPKADCVVRSHVHYYVHVEYPTKHIVITPCWELQTRFMRRNSIYRFIPDIGAVIIWVDGQAKKSGEDPIRVQKILYDLPKLNTTKL